MHITYSLQSIGTQSKRKLKIFLSSRHTQTKKHEEKNFQDKKARTCWEKSHDKHIIKCRHSCNVASEGRATFFANDHGSLLQEANFPILSHMYHKEQFQRKYKRRENSVAPAQKILHIQKNLNTQTDSKTKTFI